MRNDVFITKIKKNGKKKRKRKINEEITHSISKDYGYIQPNQSTLLSRIYTIPHTSEGLGQHSIVSVHLASSHATDTHPLYLLPRPTPKLVQTNIVSIYAGV